MPLKTLFLNPPSFENFDGGAGSRWPATREIESYWYPVWLAYPTGLLEGARLLDAPGAWRLRVAAVNGWYPVAWAGPGGGSIRIPWLRCLFKRGVQAAPEVVGVFTADVQAQAGPSG